MKAPHFLVDENFSVLLPEVAHARGYEATHINHYGLRKAKDWDILKIVAEEDWILVTNNAFEFRGRYQKLEVHPSIVFLIPTVPRQQQIKLFSAALDAITESPDMVNAALDVTQRNCIWNFLDIRVGKKARVRLLRASLGVNLAVHCPHNNGFRQRQYDRCCLNQLHDLWSVSEKIQMRLPWDVTYAGEHIRANRYALPE